MTDLELMNVRRLIAESSAKSTQRHAERLGRICDLQFVLISYYRGLLPADLRLPDDLSAKIDAMITELQP